MNLALVILTKRENAIALVGGITFFIFLFFSVSFFSNWALEISGKQKIDNIYKSIDHAAEANLEQAVGFASFPGVIDSYNRAHEGDISSSSSEQSQVAREQLRRIFDEYLVTSKKVLGKSTRIHFHLPPARSLVRLWREVQTKNGDLSDDLSAFRFTILDLNGKKSVKNIKGIEVGRGGFAIRGIAPISNYRKKLGSVEVLTSFTKFFNDIKSNHLETLGLYMNSEYLKIATKLQNVKKYPLVGTEFVQVSTTDKLVTSALVNSALLTEAKDGNVIKNIGDKEVVAFPIKDYMGTQIGIGIYILNVTHQFRAIWLMRIAYFIGISGFILTVFWLTWSIEQMHKKHALKLEKSHHELENKVKDIVMRLGQNYQEINSAVESLDDSSNLLSQSSTTQASSTDEAVAAMEEISQMIQQTNEYGKQTMGVAAEASEQVAQGLEVMKKLQESMKSIKETKKELTLIVDLIHNISSKTKIINNIVVKTELLSFNASIEAARAAEYGKGFAVVAAEVGSLARLSGKSSTDIEKLLKDGVINVEQGIGIIEEKIVDGEKVVDECLVVFNKIEQFNSTLSANINSISVATNEQTKGVEQTSVAMNDISKSTRDNLKITTATAELAKKVKSEMASLNETIEKLKQINS